MWTLLNLWTMCRYRDKFSVWPKCIQLHRLQGFIPVVSWLLACWTRCLYFRGNSGPSLRRVYFLELNCEGYIFWVDAHLNECIRESILNLWGYIQENWIYYVCSGCLDQKSLNKGQKLHKCNTFPLNFWAVNPLGIKKTTQLLLLLLIFTYLVPWCSPWCAWLPWLPNGPGWHAPVTHLLLAINPCKDLHTIKCFFLFGTCVQKFRIVFH